MIQDLSEIFSLSETPQDFRKPENGQKEEEGCGEGGGGRGRAAAGGAVNVTTVGRCDAAASAGAGKRVGKPRSILRLARIFDDETEDSTQAEEVLFVFIVHLLWLGPLK